MAPRFALPGGRQAAPIAIAVAALVFSMSCRGTLLAPSGSSMMLFAGDNAVQINGSTSVTAIVIQSGGFQEGDSAGGVGGGLPVRNGTQVVFLTTLGKIEPAEASTNEGRVEVRLLGDGRSGFARITAVSGSATAVLDVAIGTAAAAHVAVTANPQILPALGGTAAISARVEDAHGNPIAGIPVNFSASAGTLESASATTNNLGVAATVLTTTSDSIVSATTGGATGVLTDSVTVTVE